MSIEDRLRAAEEQMENIIDSACRPLDDINTFSIYIGQQNNIEVYGMLETLVKLLILCNRYTVVEHDSMFKYRELTVERNHIYVFCSIPYFKYFEAVLDRCIPTKSCSLIRFNTHDVNITQLLKKIFGLVPQPLPYS
uniref:CRAL-TRIO domain-containing protein n=1 Tax=Heterorhabditis bacteriophora TaxID=37862 RepID=A0A1I7X5P3_HETBA